MNVQHHPTEARLLDYASGALSGAARLVVAAHLGVCPDCARGVHLFEAVGGGMLDALTPSPLAPDALAHALARTERPSAAYDPLPPGPEDWIAIPPLVARAVRAAPRRRAPGAWMQAVSHGPGPARCYLLGMAAGRGVPPHSHRAGEMTVVLKGAFRDGDVILGPGDFSEHDGEVSHAPQATADGDCVCLIYTDGPLVPADWIGRIVFPLLGFG